jgi:transcriptional regulator with XRE-family HTH domain
MVADRTDDFGSRLRTARERKGISLREIASRTKISIAALEALERNDISRLPGGIFSRAFVRAYANEVGIDPEVAIQDFITEFPHDSVVAGHPRSDKVEDTVLFESERRVASSLLWILGASVAVAGAVLYLSVARSGSPRADDQIPVAPVADPSAAATGQPAASVVQRTTEPVSNPSSPSRPESSPSPRPDTSAADPAERLTIGLAARRPVWVSATADGQKVLGRLLQPGEQQDIEVTREMVITAGDASALRLTLNGADARALGKAGEVVTARLTLANFRDYLVSR